MRVLLGCSTYNGATRLEQLLKSVALRTPKPSDKLDWSMIVVDDGSPNGQATRDVMLRAGSEFASRGLSINYIEHGHNRGISAGWNTCTRYKDADAVVLVNDDVIVPSTHVGPSWLECMLRPLTTRGVGGVGANWHAFLDEDVSALLASERSDLAVTPRDCVSKALMPARRDHERAAPGRVMCPSGELFAFRRSDFDEIGGFDEAYLSFFEESCFHTSMAAQLKKVGVQINWPMCWHRWSETFKHNPELRASERMDRSRARYISKWSVPPEFHGNPPNCPFDYTNPKHLGPLPPVEVEYVAKDGTISKTSI